MAEPAVIFIVRGPRREPPPGVREVLVRRTPSLVADSDRQFDAFCVADDIAPERLRAEGWPVVAVHDGWYADDDQGGIAVWGQGRYWEVRATPFDVVRRDTDPA